MTTNLTRSEARERKRLLTVQSYDVDLDLTRGAEVFGSRSTIRFTCAEPGAGSFAELIAPRVHSAALNGRAVQVEGGRIRLDGLAADNVLAVEADCAYSHTGEGLHRFTDPADGEVYTYSQAGVYDAQRVFPCFDQPDLKAPFTVRVTAPEAWTVLSNGKGKRTAPDEHMARTEHMAQAHWEFATTPPLATYFAVVVAGPYHSVSGQHGDITLGLHCRQSLAEHLEADELFELTRQCFDFYHRTFAVPYAFGPTYDQVFLPEFNLGAMENPGCVTFRDEFLFRSKVTEAARAQRAMVIAHEMAHMWFGDLVTLRWWDDIWLNESFATYMGFLTVAEATRYRSAWTDFAGTEKRRGYDADQQPTTHPVSMAVADTDSALLNFDGISYAKGASVLKQLVAWVGFEEFVTGIRAYFAEHAHGNSSLADLLVALERTSGRDLTSWSKEWLETAGVNTLRADVVVDADGRYSRVAIEQTAADEQPTLRSHRVAVGVYDRDGDKLVRRERIEMDVTGTWTKVPGLSGTPAADLLLLNDDDLTWAKLRLDEKSTRTLHDGGLARFEDSLPRALLWGAAWDMTRDAEMAPGDYLRLVVDGIGAEFDVALVQIVLSRVRLAIDVYGDPAARADRLQALVGRSRELMQAAEPGGDLQLAFAHSFAESVAGSADVDAVRGWLAGTDVPAGLVMDADLRWLVVRRLAVLGAVGEAEIAAESERDPTSAGRERAARARASLPTAEAKAAAWSALIESDGLSNHLVFATAQGFWHPEQLDLGRTYMNEYFERIPRVWRDRTAQISSVLTNLLFPSVLVDPATLARCDGTLDRADLLPGLRRGLLELRADLDRATRARARDHSVACQ
ncbi:MAG: aminopeptidase N [Pseudonocardiales bacterium]|nr:MAG: aminopeptidase N [Pseudonocardiales bacterium]